MNLTKLKYLTLTALLLGLSLSFVKTTVAVLHSKGRLHDLRAEVKKLEQKHATLETDLAFKKSPDFIEQEARNKLNMIKPGEKVYVVGDDLNITLEKSSEDGDVLSIDSFEGDVLGSTEDTDMQALEGAVEDLSQIRTDLGHMTQNAKEWASLIF